MRNISLLLCMLSLVISSQLLAGNNRKMKKAIKKNDFETFKTLIDEGFPIYYRFSNHPVIMHAVSNNRPKMVAYLIEKGVDVNKKYTKDQTAILLASRHGCVACVPMLLEAGADPNVPSTTGWTPILTSLAHDQIEIAKMLLEQDIDPNIVNFNGYSALMVAARKGELEIARKLIAKGAKVNQGPVWDAAGEIASTDKRSYAGGQTALVLAVSYGHLDMVKLLVEAGASIYQVNEKGRSPYKAAKKYDHEEIEAYLEQVFEAQEGKKSKSAFKKGVKQTYY